MFSNPYIVPALVAFTVFIGLVAIFGLRDNKKSLKTRINQLATAGGLGNTQDGQLMSLEEKRSGLAVALESILRAFGINTEAHKLLMQPRLAQAGFTNPDIAIYYLFCKRVLSFVILIPAVLIATQDAAALKKVLNLIAGIIIATMGFYGFDIWIKNETMKRKSKLTRSFPDALDLLLVCVESGLALDAALSRVCRELGRAHPEIAFELNRTRLELALLNDRTQALQNLASRTGLTAFKSLVATLIQTEKFGTSLTETLRVLSDDYRQTRLMIAENKAGRLPAIMTVPLICFMLPALLMIIIGPPLIRLFGEGGILDK